MTCLDCSMCLTGRYCDSLSNVCPLDGWPLLSLRSLKYSSIASPLIPPSSVDAYSLLHTSCLPRQALHSPPNPVLFSNNDIATTCVLKMPLNPNHPFILSYNQHAAVMLTSHLWQVANNKAFLTCQLFFACQINYFDEIAMLMDTNCNGNVGFNSHLQIQYDIWGFGQCELPHSCDEFSWGLRFLLKI